jgi:predicted PurR-regulated permease PerM
VFFAIPLATLIKAIMSAWPQTGHPIQGNTAVPALEKV